MLAAVLDLQALRERERERERERSQIPPINLCYINLPVLIELTMISEERVSELFWPRNALSDRRLIISGTSSSSEPDDWYNGLFFQVLSGGGGEEA